VAAVAVSEGEYASLALGSDGNVYAWGWNDYGQLGNGTTTDSDVPVEVHLPGGVAAVAVSGGDYASLALGSDGNVYAWGDNSTGELGNGTTGGQSDVPVEVSLPGGAAATSASMGSDTGLAVSGGGEGPAPKFGAESPPLVVLQGSAYSAIFPAQGRPTYSLAGAPSWLTVTPTGAVTGTAPDGTSTFTYSVSATNAAGTAVAGPFTVTVQPTVPVAGTVVAGPAATPVVGSVVQACATTGGECDSTTTSSTGTFTLSAAIGASVVLTAYPPHGSELVTTSAGPLTVPAGGAQGETIAMNGTAPLPGDLQVNGSSNPTLNWGSPSTATVTGCANGLATVSVIGQNTQTGQYDANVVPLTETPPGSGTYSGVIPPQYPVHGPVEIDPSVSCPPQSALFPSLGPSTGGNTVYITGSGFTGATGVNFGDVPATSYTVGSDAVIEAIAPPGSGTVPVTVDAGTSSTVVDQYTYQAVVSVSPSTGPAAGGTRVVITGTGLASAEEVLFGSTPAAFTVVSDSEVDAVSPPGTGTQDVTVETLYGGTTPARPADQFTYAANGATSVPGLAITSGSLHTVALHTVAQVLHLAAASAPVTLSGRGPARLSRTSNVVLANSLSLANILNVIRQVIFSHPDEVWRDLLDTKELTDAIDSGVAGLKSQGDICDEGFQQEIVEMVSLAVGPYVNAAAMVAASEYEGYVMLALVPLDLLTAGTTVLVGFLVPLLVVLMFDMAVDNFIGAVVKAAADNAGCPTEPNAEIDPSGTVLDTNGNPVAGATVTILRSDTSAGPFTAVDPTLPGIDPATNPETTGSDGVFHWDVDSGWYEVTASAPGCNVPGDTSQAAATIGPYPVPPPQVGLTVTLACPGEAPSPVPTVTSLSENTGPPGGGTSVMVLGTGFTPSSTVSFGGTPAPAVTYMSPEALTVTSPPGTGTADVVVTTAGGSSATSSADQFFYGSAPTVTGVSPQSGPVAGGTTVTVSGTGFTGATAVAFGGVPAASFTVVSGSEIQVVAPAGTPGTVDVEVVTPAGASAQGTADQYIYVGTAPAFTSGTPPSSVTVGSSYSYTFAASGSPAPAFSVASGNLPPGVALAPGDGVLSGAPTTPGTFTFSVAASNGVQPEAVSPALTVSVDEAPAITSTASSTFTAGTPGSLTVATSGYPAPALSEAGILPSGVSFTDNGDGTATLSGTPAAGTGGTYRFTFTAHNGTSPDATQAFTLTVDEAPAITSTASATLTAAVGDTATISTTGFPVPGLTETGALPAGASFTDNGNGTATIAATANAASVTMFQVTASNGVSLAATQDFTLTVVAPKGLAVLLRASRTSTVADEPVALTAATNRALAPGLAVDIVDQSSGKVVASCTTGHVCRTTVANGAGSRTYQAVIAKPDGTGVQASSAPLSVTWAPSTVALRASATSTVNGLPVLLSAHANEDVGPTGYAVDIVDTTTGTVVASCSRGTSCSTWARGTTGRQVYEAVIGTPAGLAVQASSSAVTVTWAPSTVTLSASSSKLAQRGGAMLTATANENVGRTPWVISITDLTIGKVLRSCDYGSTCNAWAHNTSGSHTYQAVIAAANGTNVQATSATVTVTW
jgi:hypothetical protein